MHSGSNAGDESDDDVQDSHSNRQKTVVQCEASVIVENIVEFQSTSAAEHCPEEDSPINRYTKKVIRSLPYRRSCADSHPSNFDNTCKRDLFHDFFTKSTLKIKVICTLQGREQQSPP